VDYVLHMIRNGDVEVRLEGLGNGLASDCSPLLSFFVYLSLSCDIFLKTVAEILL